MAPPDDDVAASRVVSQLAHAVLLTRFDLSAVSMEDVAGMARDGADLRRFRAMLLRFAETVPPEADQATRDAAVAALVDEVVTAWQEFQRRLPARLSRIAAAGGTVLSVPRTYR